MGSGFGLVRDDRGVLSLTGPDTVSFLQGLISNDAARAAPDRAIWSALLTPQGKFLHDFFLVVLDGRLLLDCEGERRADLFQRLRRYKLRSKVDLVDETEGFAVAQLWGADAAAAVGLSGTDAGAAAPWAGGVAFVDPRLPGLGIRAILPRAEAERAISETGLAPGSPADLDRLRLQLGVPDGSRDLPVEKAFLLESGFDELNGVDWQKGCYVGQELTARTKYRGLVRKRLMPVRIEGTPDDPEGRITLDGRDAGELRSHDGDWGLALLRLEAVSRADESGSTLTCGNARLAPVVPDWIRLPPPAA